MAEFSEKEVYEIFGLGEREQESAEPAQDPHDEGENEQEVAEPAENDENNAEEEEKEIDEAEESVGEKASQKPSKAQGEEAGELSQEQRRENAARRRREEQRAAIDQAVQQALAEERGKQAKAMEAFFTKAGLKNTITGKPITSMEEFESWNKAFAQSRLERDLKAGKLTEDGLTAVIEKHPVIQQAQAFVQQQEQAARAAEEAAARARVDQELQKIQRVDASIHSLEDLFNAPYGKELYEMVKKGYSLPDAHYLLNRDKIEKARGDAAKQQAQLSARGKAHMTPTTGAKGTGTVSVPKDQMTWFRAFNPDASDEEIQAFYNKSLKK